jgi:nucleotide-binding universal stress UspA family protein
MIQTVLVPTDGSEHADKAVAFAADLAQKYGARIVLLHVMTDVGTGRVPDELRGLQRLEHVDVTERDIRQAAVNELLRTAEKTARAHGAEAVETVVLEGRPASGILDCARERGVDLIVMGSRGVGDLKGLLMGSTSHKVAHLAECTCVSVR